MLPAPKIYPASYAQERLWLLDRLNPGNPAFNMFRVLYLQGPVVFDFFQQSLAQFIERHESLRATFGTQDGQLKQFIRPYTGFELPRSRVIDAPDLNTAIQHYLDEERHHRFNLKRGPLARFRWVDLEQGEALLVQNLHHALTDGWSYSLFVSELSRLYEAQHEGRSAELPVLPITYGDYAAEQRRAAEQGVFEGQLDYWAHRLKDLPALDLPLDEARRTASSEAGDSVLADIPIEQVQRLAALSEALQVTAFVVLLAVFKLLLSRLSGQTDFAVGVPVAGRSKLEYENLFGIFLNSLVIRSDLSGSLTFDAWVRQLRADVADALSRQDLPFERIVESLAPERDLARSPLFQVMLNMQPFSKNFSLNPNIPVSEHLPEQPASILDLTLYVYSRPDGYSLRLVYNPELFAAARMQVFMQQFTGLLAQVLDHPGRSLQHYSLLTEPLPLDAPDRAGQVDLIHNRLDYWASKTPQAPAIHDSNVSWSYAELRERSDQLAAALIRAGVQPGDTVAVHAARKPELVPAVMGVLKSGAAFLMLDPAYPETRLSAMLAQAQARTLIEVAPLAADFAAAHENLIRIRPADLTRSELLPDWPTVDADALAVIGFTSGSSGEPKGILGRHGSLTHFYPWMAAEFDLDHRDRFSMLSGLAHDPLQRDIFTAIWLGAALYIPPQRALENPDTLLTWMKSSAISFCHLTPALGKLLALATSQDQTPLPDLRWTFFVGDQLTASDVNRLRMLAPQTNVINAFGSTESQRAVSMQVFHANAPLPPGAEVLPIGAGIPGAELRVLNAAGQPCGLGELGEIHIESDYLAAGYLNDPELSAARFIYRGGHRLYRTGDLGRFLPDGTVAASGRSDRQIKVRGYRIEPAEIEAALSRHPQVEDAVVIFRPDLAGGQLVAYLVATVPPDIHAFLSRQLPPAMLPAHYLAVELLPMTPNGKLDPTRLPAPALDSPEPVLSEYKNDQESQIGAIFAELMTLDHAGPQTDFFTAGGHSLLAVQLMSRIKAEFGVELPLATLFRAPQVRDLAGELRMTINREQGTLVPIQPAGSRPPMYLVHPIGGHVFSYFSLSKALGPDFPVYGLKAFGWDDGVEPMGSIKEMAAAYVAAIRAHQPQGPYLLGGYSFGAVVAHEAAVQLSQAGQSVPLLALIDSYLTRTPRFLQSLGGRARLRHEVLRRWGKLRHRLWLIQRAHGPERTRMMRYFFKWRGQPTNPYHRALGEQYMQKLDHIPRALMLRRRHDQIRPGHLPGYFPGRAVLFQASETGKHIYVGWPALCGQLIRQTIPGNHYNVLQEPHVEATAAALRVMIDQVAGSQIQRPS
jgi:amino acid adenylation domain-containing protein